MKLRIALIAATFVLSACATSTKRTEIAAPTTLAPADQLSRTLDAVALNILKESPEFATSLAVSETQAGGPYGARLSDLSAEGMNRRISLARTHLEMLEAIDPGALSPADKVSRAVVAEALRDAAAGGGFGYGTYGFAAAQPYVVTQIDGAYVSVPDFLDSQHPIKSEADAQAYLTRLTAYAAMLDQETARIKADAGRGVVPPDFVIDGALKQLKAFTTQKPADMVLVTSLKRRALEAVGDDKAAALTTQAEQIVAETVLPAYRRQIDALTAIRPQATHEAGIWRLPDGEKLYAAALRAWTTSDMTPDQIHELGLALVEKITAEMDAILDAQGLAKGTVAARMQQLAARKSLRYANTEAGKAKLLKDLNAQVEALQPLLPQYFSVLPKAKLEIKRVPSYIEAGAPGGYYQPPALDGSRPGAYYINLRNTAEWPRHTLPTLTYHEGVPGHHFQIAIQQESSGLPFIRSALLIFSGYTEGWGLYAEQAADELGVYKDDPLGRLGYLQSMAFRATRLVVDTGMHHKKWTREKAINYMEAVTGDERSAVVTEIERYAVWPGQACAYMVGRETINRLREEARAALGERFDIRGFHAVILANGSMPLSVMENIVRDWVAERKAAS